MRVRRLNRYVEETQPWQLAKDPARADELATTLRSLAEGLRVVTVLLNAVHPGVDREAARRAGRAGHRRSRAPCTASHPGGQPVAKLAPLFPKPE